jgi:hypothetical protein
LHCRRLRNATHWLKLICSDNATLRPMTVTFTHAQISEPILSASFLMLSP